MTANTEIINISKEFGAFKALDQIHLSIGQGEFVAILGPSGCGKTTLLRLMAGFESPSDGTIRMNEQEVASRLTVVPPEKRNLGMVFQSFALWPHMNVREHIRFPLLHHRFLDAELNSNIDIRIDEVLDIVGLKHLEKRMPSELSGGQRQRVALGRAIAPKPSLLLMDEPLSNLDAELRLEMRKEIQQLHRLTGATIMYVTHDQGEALAMADRIVVMKDGQIEQVGTPQEIYCLPKTEFVATFVGKANMVIGVWENNQFIVNGQGRSIVWNNSAISEELKRKNLYPVRPEELKLSRNGQGIQGTIINVQYQGKEIHYTVRVNDEVWTVHEDITQSFVIGDNIYIELKNQPIQCPYTEVKHELEALKAEQKYLVNS